MTPFIKTQQTQNKGKTLYEEKENNNEDSINCFLFIIIILTQNH